LYWVRINTKSIIEALNKASSIAPLVAVLLSIYLWHSPQAIGQQSNWPDEAACRQNVPADDVSRGWCLAIDPAKGNCIACHTFNVSPWPSSIPVAGNIAPPLVAMKPRFPDIAALKSLIEGGSNLNPSSIMPPYLVHGILTKQEIDLIVTFLLSI